MSLGNSEPNSTQGVTTLVGEYGRWGDLEISGSPEALRQLAGWLRSGRQTMVTLTVPDTPPTPYAGYLVNMRIHSSDDAVEIARQNRTLIIKGRADCLDTLAANLEFLAKQAEEGTVSRYHVHEEYFQGHFYLSPTSEPLVVTAIK